MLKRTIFRSLFNLFLTSTILQLSSCSYEPESEDVWINRQKWMTRNLNVSTFRNGDPITHAKNAKEWKHAAENKIPAYCYYGYDSVNGEKYGKLYNWYAVNDPKKLAPKKWEIPRNSDWSELFQSLGGYDSCGYSLKSKRGWKDDGNGVHNAGFFALPGGYCEKNGQHSGFSEVGLWWSSDDNRLNHSIPDKHRIPDSVAVGVIMVHQENGARTINGDKGLGLSVRCIESSIND